MAKQPGRSVQRLHESADKKESTPTNLMRFNSVPITKMIKFALLDNRICNIMVGFFGKTDNLEENGTRCKPKNGLTYVKT